MGRRVGRGQQPLDGHIGVRRQADVAVEMVAEDDLRLLHVDARVHDTAVLFRTGRSRERPGRHVDRNDGQAVIEPLDDHAEKKKN